jgi:hypothetical protein
MLLGGMLGGGDPRTPHPNTKKQWTLRSVLTQMFLYFEGPITSIVLYRGSH